MSEPFGFMCEITQENKVDLARLIVAFKLDGQVCRFCGKGFGQADIDDAVYAGKVRRKQAYAHKKCWRPTE